MSDREEKLRQADFSRQDQVLNRSEFIDLCVNVMWDTPLDQLKGAAENYSAFKVAKLRRINVRWQRVADYVDRESRLWVPLLYSLGLCALMNTRFTDSYLTRKRYHGMQMEKGFTGAKVEWHWWGISLAWIIGICIVTAVAMYTHIILTWRKHNHGKVFSSSEKKSRTSVTTEMGNGKGEEEALGDA